MRQILIDNENIHKVSYNHILCNIENLIYKIQSRDIRGYFYKIELTSVSRFPFV